MIRLIKVAQDVAVKTGTSAVINLKAVLATRRVKTDLSGDIGADPGRGDWVRDLHGSLVDGYAAVRRPRWSLRRSRRRNGVAWSYAPGRHARHSRLLWKLRVFIALLTTHKACAFHRN